jgi:fucose permease
MIAATAAGRRTGHRESKRPRSVGTGAVAFAMGGYSAVMVPFMSGWISQMNGYVPAARAGTE